MLLATLLSLGAAILHAGWNFVAKRADEDRFILLWAQFAVAGVVAGIALAFHAAVVGMPASGYGWAMVSASVHLPYIWLLARAYTIGNFSVSYPIARGGGAALAAIGGVVLLSDHLAMWQVIGIAVVVFGLGLLSWTARRPEVVIALMVACTIGTYTIVDAHGSRTTGSAAYVLATFAAFGVTITAFGVITGRATAMRATLTRAWRRALVTGVASLVTYGMVLVAVQHAPVGYVTALRESSVVLAAFAGWRVLDEGSHRRRITAAAVVVTGLVMLVVGR